MSDQGQQRTFPIPEIGANPQSSDGILTQINQSFSLVSNYLQSMDMEVEQLNSRNAVIQQYAPLDQSVQLGDLVYFDADPEHTGTNMRFKPALAALLPEHGEFGQSLEAPSARVLGIVIQRDAAAPVVDGMVLGSILMGGYWQDSDVLNACLGTYANMAGTYYLSPEYPGMATPDPGTHLRQPLLFNLGGGKFCLNIFYMAHDNHFHGSYRLVSDRWQPIDTPPEGVTPPESAVYWYQDSTTAWVGMEPIAGTTTAIFMNGLLQPLGLDDSLFIISDGYIWYTGSTAPSSTDIVEVFNHYPFAYNSPVVRSIESTSPRLTVTTSNGVVTLIPDDYTAGATTRQATAISNIQNGVIYRTSVISGLSAGPGMQVQLNSDGSAVVSSANIIGSLIDAYSINNNQTNITSDGTYIYYTFPKGRSASLTMTQPIAAVGSSTQLAIRAWCVGVGTGASFNVKFYWTPQPTEAGSTVQVASGLAPIGEKTLTFGSVSDSTATYAETEQQTGISGSGLITAVMQISSTPNVDIRLLRLGFKLEVISADLAAAVQPVAHTTVTGISNTATAATTISKYHGVRMTASGLAGCNSGVASYCGELLGIAIASASASEAVDYIIQGTISDDTWSYTPGTPLYLGVDGSIITTDPAVDDNAKYIQRIGTAISATSIQIMPNVAVLKE